MIGKWLCSPTKQCPTPHSLTPQYHVPWKTDPYPCSQCLNVLYLLNTQIKHSTLHNSDLDYIIMESITQMLQFTHKSSHSKIIKAHANVDGNKQAYKLAKLGCKLHHMNMHTPLHIISKTIGGTLWTKHHMEAPSYT